MIAPRSRRAAMIPAVATDLRSEVSIPSDMPRQVHPKAALFPMLSAEELTELAADIKANGLQVPIMLDKDGLLIDGRNRLAACEIAKVKPTFATLNGGDAEAFIISQNLARRHMNAGQRAMVVAIMFPDPEGVGRGKKGCVAQQFPMVGKEALSRARKVLRLAPDVAPNVLSGATSLEQAYIEARNLEQLAESDEAKLKMLRDNARDLADLVAENRMKLDEAVAALHERQRKRAEVIEHGKQAATIGMTRFLGDVASIISAIKETNETIIDKNRVNQVVKAVEQLQFLVRE